MDQFIQALAASTAYAWVCKKRARGNAFEEIFEAGYLGGSRVAVKEFIRALPNSEQKDRATRAYRFHFRTQVYLTWRLASSKPQSQTGQT